MISCRSKRKLTAALHILLVLFLCLGLTSALCCGMGATSSDSGNAAPAEGEQPVAGDEAVTGDEDITGDGTASGDTSEDTPVTDTPAGGGGNTETQPEDTPEASAPTDSCICGRPYYTSDGDGHRQFDCVKCNINNRSCTCDCWCGADSYAATSSTGQQVLYCARCNKLCTECTCVDKELALIRENEIRSGKLSVMGIQKPSDVFASLFLLVFMTAVSVFGVYAFQTTFGTAPAPAAQPSGGPEPAGGVSRHGGLFTHKKDIPEKARTASGRASSANIKSVAGIRAGFTPAVNLYSASMSMFTGRKASVPVLSQPTGGRRFTLNGDDLTEYCLLSGLNADGTPVRLTGKTGNPAHLIAAGLAEDTDGETVLTDRGNVYARVIFTPEETVAVGTDASPLWYLCVYKGYGMAVVETGGAYTVIADVKRDTYASFIGDSLAPAAEASEKSVKFSESLSYGEWLVLMSVYAENSVSFGLRSLARVEKAEFFTRIIASSRRDAAFPSPEEVLDTESVLRCLSSLTRKGFVSGSDGAWSLTGKGSMLSFDGLRDMLFFDRRFYGAEGPEITLIAVYGSKGCVTVCDTGTELRLISSNNIPWHRYIQ